MGAYSGKTGVVYMSTTGTGAATSVLQLNQWAISRTTDKQEVTPFNSANKTYVLGFPDLTGTIGGFFNDAESKPYAAADSADGIKLYLYPSSNAPSKYWYGPAWLDVSMDTPASGPVAISMSFAANGSWGNTL